MESDQNLKLSDVSTPGSEEATRDATLIEHLSEPKGEINLENNDEVDDSGEDSEEERKYAEYLDNLENDQWIYII